MSRSALARFCPELPNEAYAATLGFALPSSTTAPANLTEGAIRVALAAAQTHSTTTKITTICTCVFFVFWGERGGDSKKTWQVFVNVGHATLQIQPRTPTHTNPPWAGQAEQPLAPHVSEVGLSQQNIRTLPSVSS